jgi:hypothetical protein
MTYQDFSEKIRDALLEAKRPLTWTEIRTAASLPQAFPNNQWVHRMEQDIGLYRHRDHKAQTQRCCRRPQSRIELQTSSVFTASW